MAVDPYLFTWLPRHGGGLILAVVWFGAAVTVLARGRRWPAFVLSALSMTVGGALGTHLVPLLVSAPLPASTEALAIAAASPFVAFAILAVFPGPVARASLPASTASAAGPVGTTVRLGMDLATLLPVFLVSHGAAAWFFSLALIGRGWLAPAMPQRRSLALGLLLLALATGVEHQRFELEQGLPASAATVSSAASGFEVAGWAAITVWAVQSRRQA